MVEIRDLLKRLVSWFLGKAPSKLETFEEESIAGNGITLIRYRRKTARAYRTWRAVYKGLEYDLIFGWDTLAYLPDVPLTHKRDRLSTHSVSIYKQGLHARYNPVRGCHEPDVTVLLSDEVCLEAALPSETLQRWRNITKAIDRPIQTTSDLIDRIMDEIAKYALRHPPHEIEPAQIAWTDVVEQTARVFLGKGHTVFPAPTSEAKPKPLGTEWL